MAVSTPPVSTETSPVITGDLSEVTEKLEELKEVLTEEKEPETVLVGEVEMTPTDILAEILEKVEPDIEQIQISNDLALAQQAILSSQLESNNELLEKVEELILQLDQTEQMMIEGNYFIGLSVVIAFAIYMFWNQLTKW